MIAREWVTTQLMSPSERPPIPMVGRHPTRFRMTYVVLRLLYLLIQLGFMRLGPKHKRPTYHQKAAAGLGKLGMIWIRATQFFVVRSPIFSSEFGALIQNLKDPGKVHPFDRIEKVIRRQLGCPLDQVFDRFEKTPFAATTVSQIHRARLSENGAWVAVKVQKPEAETMFNKDLKLLSMFVNILNSIRFKPGMRWDDLYHELSQIKVRELNYHYEAAALKNLKKNLAGQMVHVPRVYERHGGKALLVTEFIQGALLSDLTALSKTDPKRLQQWLTANHIDPKIIARRLFFVVYRQIFEDNFFHGDMNTGNIILLRNSQVAIIDCRETGSLEAESLAKQKMYLRALSEGEFVTAAEIHFLLADRLPRVDLNTVKEELVRIWRVWETRTHVEDIPYHQKSLTYMSGQLNRVVRNYRFGAQWSFSKLSGTLAHLDTALASLSPDLNYLNLLRVYFSHLEGRQARKKLLNLPARLTASLTALHEMPKRMAEYSLFQETLMRRQAQVVQGSATKLDAVIAACFGFLSFTTMVAGFVLGWMFLARYKILHADTLGTQLKSWAEPLMPLGVVAWLGLFSLVWILISFCNTQKHKFAQREFGQPAPTPNVGTQ